MDVSPFLGHGLTTEIRGQVVSDPDYFALLKLTFKSV